MDSKDTPLKIRLTRWWLVPRGNLIHPILSPAGPARPDFPIPVLSNPITYDRPVTDFQITRHTQSQSRPNFRIVTGDPVKVALSNAAADSMKSLAIGRERIRIPNFHSFARSAATGLAPVAGICVQLTRKIFTTEANLFDTLIQPRLGMI
ncbi:hypothetical protein E4U16_006067 [Claviceps sp. LM84 group G4]|nr:hypothetical protein E4U16_006067 [Claviceps sp. LM84 group G4]